MSRLSHQSTVHRDEQQQRQAQLVETAIERLKAAGLEVVVIDEHVIRVAGAYDYTPASETWKSLATGKTGYTIRTLIPLAKVAAA